MAQQTDYQAVHARPEPTPAREKTSAELVRDLSAELNRLVRDEMRLATAELQQKGKRAGLGFSAAGSAAVVAFLGCAALVATAILGLAMVMQAWLSALLVGGGLLVLAALVGGFGAMKLKQSTPAKPEEAMEGLGKDIEAVKGTRR